MTETTAGHRFPEGRARFNRLAGIFLLLCGLNATAYIVSLNRAISSGQAVTLLESHEPDVLSFKGEHARVAPEVRAMPRIEDFEMFGVFCLGLLLGGTGIWLVWFAIKKRFVLIARTAHGESRMVFHPSATREDVIEFATRATRRHGYPFDFGQGLVG